MLFDSSAYFAYSAEIGSSARAAANRAVVIGLESEDIVVSLRALGGDGNFPRLGGVVAM